MRRISTVLLLLLGAAASAAAAQAGPGQFRSCADISGPISSGSLYQVPLSGVVLEGSERGFGDLRLFGRGGREVPFVVIEAGGRTRKPEIYPFEITGYEPDGSGAVMTMNLPERHGPISMIDLEIPDQDFKKRALLESSRDGRTWQALADDVIFDFSSQVDLRKTRIAFPPSDARYYRLRLSSAPAEQQRRSSLRLQYEGLDLSVNAMPEKELSIHSVEGRSGTPQDEAPVYDEKTFMDLRAELDRDGNTVIAFETRLPLERLFLDIATPYYYRTAQLHGSDTGRDGSWRLLARDALYRLPFSPDRREAKNVLDPRGAGSVFFRIQVLNKGNAPLEVRSLTARWVRKNLYFIAVQDAAPLQLCFGAPGLERPEYDLAHLITADTLPQHPAEHLEIAGVRAVGGKGPLSSAERREVVEKIVLRTVVAVLVIGLGFWLYRLMQKGGRGREDGKNKRR